MKLSTNDGLINVAHLIPTKGRAALMMKNMSKMRDSWNRPGTYLAIHEDELFDYSDVIHAIPDVNVVEYGGDATVGLALEVLRRRATKAGYDYYVMSDDNCTFTKKSFHNLVRATAEWGEPVHMAGSHGTSSFFHKGKMKRTMIEKHGLRSYRQMTWIFRCVSHALYEPFRYPHDLPCYADRYFSFWLLRNGVRHFRATPDAPFGKTRFQSGGIGRKDERTHTSVGAATILQEFPDVMKHLEVRFPWEEILKLYQPKIRIRLNKSHS